MVIPILSYEIKRLSNKKIFFIAIFLIAITLYFDNIGITEYQNFLKSKEIFKQYEKNKIRNYLTYDQYGGYGFRLMFEPSPLIIFFEQSQLTRNLESNLNVLQIIPVYDNMKGRAIFNEGTYKDFGGCIYLFGSLFMLYMGIINFKNRRFVKLVITRKNILLSILIRIGLLNLLFIIIFALNYTYGVVHAIPFSADDTRLFVYFCLNTLFFLDFFYGVGLLCFSIFKASVVPAAITWLILIIIIPEINLMYIHKKSETIPPTESLNLKKLELLMSAEKQIYNQIQKMKNKKTPEELELISNALADRYWKKVYNVNEQAEREFNGTVLEIIEISEKRAIISPATFYQYLKKEISGKGYSGYKDFLNQVDSMGSEFFKFYINKRYIERSHQIEPFIKDDENIIKNNVRLPINFWPGFIISALYVLITLAISYAILQRELNDHHTEAFEPNLNYKKGKMYIVWSENKNLKDMIFNFYKQTDRMTCIDDIRDEDLESDAGPKALFVYLCKLMGADRDEALKNMALMGITDFRNEPFAKEINKKIYCAVGLATQKDIFVLKDVVRYQSRDFENNVLELVDDKMQKNAIVIYLTEEIPQVNTPLSKHNLKDQFQKYYGFEVADPFSYILR
ncbi:MAG: hypothetical protein ACM3SY_16585 [Candidatus Omnitrophota bacterium]